MPSVVWVERDVVLETVDEIDELLKCASDQSSPNHVAEHGLCGRTVTLHRAADGKPVVIDAVLLDYDYLEAS